MALMRPGQKGLAMEEALKSYFWKAGYFVLRGLPFRLAGEDVTDIDLWLYEKSAGASRRRTIVDIKNRRSPKASERVIWTRGLQSALGVEASIVATTDTREGNRRLARQLGVALLDGEALTKISASESQSAGEQITNDDLDQLIKEVDESRRSSDWRSALGNARAMLLDGLGVQSTNSSLSASSFFAEQAVLAYPRSKPAEAATRLTYLTAAFASISLDYFLAENAFRSPEDRQKIIIDGIRFGSSRNFDATSTIRNAIGLARRYADNGSVVSKQIELGFLMDAERIPAEIIATFISKMRRSDALFQVGRELERAALASELAGFDSLPTDVRALLGVMLDFNGISREKLALAWPTKQKSGVDEKEPKLFDLEPGLPLGEIARVDEPKKVRPVPTRRSRKFI